MSFESATGHSGKFIAIRAISPAILNDEEKAKEILKVIPDFYDEAKFLLHKLHDHNQ